MFRSKKDILRRLSLAVAMAVIAVCLSTAAYAETNMIMGDVTGDGIVDAEDSLHILRFSVELEEFTPQQKKAADFNGDKYVDSYDSLIVLRSSVGLSPTDDDGDDDFTADQTRLLELCNKERAKKGLSPLVLDKELCRLANIRANEISQMPGLEHKRLDGRSWDTIIDDNNIPFSYRDENIGAAKKKSADLVFEFWMDSEYHRAGILGTQYNKIGIGYYRNENSQYINYWCQIFTD